MILLIDIGNSNIVFGTADNDSIIDTGRAETVKDMTEKDFTAALMNFLDNADISPENLSGTVIASVVPSLTATALKTAETMTGSGAFCMSYDTDHGINLDIEHPEHVGQDLIAGAVGAASFAELPAIIIDMGTATTITVVDKNKTYLGGLILAGARICADAMHKRASQLPLIERFEAPKSIFAKNTADSMSWGIIYSNAAMIDGICSRMEDELGEKCSVIATGGLCKTVIPYCKREVIYDEYLVLRGMREFYKRVAGNIK